MDLSLLELNCTTLNLTNQSDLWRDKHQQKLHKVELAGIVAALINAHSHVQQTTLVHNGK